MGRQSNAVRLVSTEDGFVVVNPNADRVAFLSRDGDVRRIVGGAGSGPGEFQRPSDVEVVDGDVFVLEMGNPRVQRLDVQGNMIRTYAYVAGSAITNILTRDDGGFWLGGYQVCEEGGICLLSGIDLDAGTTTTAVPLEQSPGNVSYQFARDEGGHLFVINVHGTNAEMLDSRGQSLRQVVVHSESVDSFADKFQPSGSPQEQLMARIEAGRTLPHTFVAAIAARDGRLYVQHGRANYDDNGPAYLLDVFSYGGDLIYQGIPTEGRLQGWHEDRLVFVETLDTEPHGEVRVEIGRISSAT